MNATVGTMLLAKSASVELSSVAFSDNVGSSEILVFERSSLTIQSCNFTNLNGTVRLDTNWKGGIFWLCSWPRHSNSLHLCCRDVWLTAAIVFPLNQASIFLWNGDLQADGCLFHQNNVFSVRMCMVGHNSSENRCQFLFPLWNPLLSLTQLQLPILSNPNPQPPPPFFLM